VIGSGGSIASGSGGGAGPGSGGRVGPGSGGRDAMGSGGRVTTGSGGATGGSGGMAGRGSGGTTGGGSGGASGGCTRGSCPSTLTCPAGFAAYNPQNPGNGGCGCYTVTGLCNNKRALINAGANLEMIASAMMETEMLDTNYTPGDGKTGDSYNLGTCKQNWGMIRMCHTAWSGFGQTGYSRAEVQAMNTDRALDVTVYKECRARFADRWWAGHRNGASGLANPDTQDIRNFRAAYDWTLGMLAGHDNDDVRVWVRVPPILLQSEGEPAEPLE
jgi:hypothetical protein